ncbi:methyltransferase [Bacillus sp. JCM 19047]|nr:methyltransferase [Bacillus sp. JCM 19047]
MIPLVYDQLNRFGKDDEFILALLEKANVHVVADLGCGTGRLTVHYVERGYDVTGIDPNEEALAYAKKKWRGKEVNWVLGDSSTLKEETYDVVVLTANVAQVFLTEQSWKKTLQDAYRGLKKGGHLIFDSRNPEAKVWEQWEQDDTPDLAVHEQTGEPLEIWTTYDGFIDDVYTFYETVKGVQSGEVYVTEKMKLKFRSHETLQQSLEQAGFSSVYSYGDWEFKKATPTSSSFIFHGIK